MQNTISRGAGCKRTALAVALMSAFGIACAEDEVAALIKPESSVSVGAAGVSGNSKDRAFFGQYSGIRTDNAYGQLDINFAHRNDETGTWTTLFGRNLGLDNRELMFGLNKQGDWKIGLSYDEIVRRDPRTINTALAGSGTTHLTVNRLASPGTGTDLNLQTKRQALGLEGEKWLTRSLQFEFNFKNEEKKGARLFGIGYDCANYVCATTQNATNTRWALLLLPEPISSTTKQFESKLNYMGEKIFLSAGYYGSFYTNDFGSMQATVPGQLYNAIGTLTTLNAAAAGGTSLQNVLQSPVALPPDNQAHQFYLSGNYAFTPTTKATFKYAYTHATQHEDFATAGLSNAPAGRANFGGEINTTLAQLGLTSRPLPKLSLVANVRYEDKKDKTPIDLYNIENAATWYNSPQDSTKLSGKLEASYQILNATRATLGVDYQSIKRALPSATLVDVAGIGALRGQTEEVSYRAELRRSLFDNFSGAIAYITSKRTGSDWYSLCTSAACNTAGVGYGASVSDTALVRASTTAIFPIMLQDRVREKYRVSADWNPLDRLSLQFSAERGTDHYTTAGVKGASNTGMTLYGADAALTLTEKWALTGFASYGDQSLNVSQGSGGYNATPTNMSMSYGFGVKGQPTGRISVGADLSHLRDVIDYKLSFVNGSNANNNAQTRIGLPDVHFVQTTLKAFAKYTVDKNSDVRVDLIHQRSKYEDWAWGYSGVPFAYSDGTTVSTKSKQNVTFLGAAYNFRWQ